LPLAPQFAHTRRQACKRRRGRFSAHPRLSLVVYGQAKARLPVWFCERTPPSPLLPLRRGLWEWALPLAPQFAHTRRQACKRRRGRFSAHPRLSLVVYGQAKARLPVWFCERTPPSHLLPPRKGLWGWALPPGPSICPHSSAGVQEKEGAL